MDTHISRYTHIQPPQSGYNRVLTYEMTSCCVDVILVHQPEGGDPEWRRGRVSSWRAPRRCPLRPPGVANVEDSRCCVEKVCEIGLRLFFFFSPFLFFLLEFLQRHRMQDRFWTSPPAIATNHASTRTHAHNSNQACVSKWGVAPPHSAGTLGRAAAARVSLGRKRLCSWSQYSMFKVA